MSREAKILFKDAKKQLDEKNFDVALTICQKMLSVDEHFYNAYIIQGAAQVELDKLNDAAATFEKAISLDESSPLAWQGLGKVYESKRMLTKIRRGRIADVFRRLVQLHSSKENDSLKLAKFQCLLARTLLYELSEKDLIKGESNSMERLTDAGNCFHEAWSILSIANGTTHEFAPIFYLFLEQLRPVCSMKGIGNLVQVFNRLQSDVYSTLFQLKLCDNDYNTNDFWHAVILGFSEQDLAAIIDECVAIVSTESNGGELLSLLWRLITIKSTAKSILMYCHLLLEKNINQPQIAKVRQLVNEESAVLREEYKRQSGPRESGKSKFEQDNLHLVYGCLAIFDGNLDLALKELSAISEPESPIVFVYLARAYTSCGQLSEAISAASQGLKLLSQSDKSKGIYCCHFDKRVLLVELESLKILGLLESGFEPSYNSIVQEVCDLASQSDTVAFGNETLAYIASRLFAIGLLNTNFSMNMSNSLRKLEVEMRQAVANGDPEKALVILEQSLVSDADNDISILSVQALACSYLDSTEYLSRGTSAARKALSISSKYPPAHWAMGRCLLKLNQFDDAEKHLAEAATLQPLNSAIAYDYCKLLFSCNRHEECAAVASQLVSVSTPAQWPYIRLALYHLEQKNSSSAIQLLLSALRCPQSISEAVENYNLDSKTPKNERLITLWRCLGSAYLQKGSLASAVRALNHCASLSASQKFDTASASVMSEALLRLGRLEAVIKCLVDSEPSSNGSVNLRKFIQIASAELQSAQASKCPECTYKLAKRVVEILLERTSPKQWNVTLFWKLLGDASVLLSDAVDHLTKSERPSLSDKSVAILQLQTAPSSQQDWLILACRFYSTALKLNPSLSLLWSDLAVARTKMQSFGQIGEECVKTHLVGTQLHESHASWANLGAICLLVGHKTAAQHIFLSLLPYAGQSPVLLVSLCVLYLLAKKLEQAEVALGYARKMIEAGCVETVTRPQVVGVLYLIEAAFNLQSGSAVKLKQLVDIIQLVTSLPLSLSFRWKMKSIALVLRRSFAFFSKNSTVETRKVKLSCRVFFEQLMQVVDECQLILKRQLKAGNEDEILSQVAGLCGHIVEMMPAESIQWRRSAELFESAGAVFEWQAFRAKCLSRCYDMSSVAVSERLGSRSLYLACLVAYTQKSEKLPEVMTKTSRHFDGNLDLKIAVGLAYALCGSFSTAKEIFVKVLIELKQSTEVTESTAEWRLMGILAKIAALTGDGQLHSVVINFSGPSLLSNELFKLVKSQRVSLAMKFVHQAPYRRDAWKFALRHQLLCNPLNTKFCEMAVKHIQLEDRALWNALLRRDSKTVSKAVHARPFDSGFEQFFRDGKVAKIEFLTRLEQTYLC